MGLSVQKARVATGARCSQIGPSVVVSQLYQIGIGQTIDLSGDMNVLGDLAHLEHGELL